MHALNGCHVVAVVGAEIGCCPLSIYGIIFYWQPRLHVVGDIWLANPRGDIVFSGSFCKENPLSSAEENETSP